MNESPMRLSAPQRKEPIIIGQPAIAIKETKSHSMPVCLGVLAPDAGQSGCGEAISERETGRRATK